MDNLNSFLDFAKNVVFTTANQLFWLLGLIFILGLILYLFARFTRITYVKSIGQKFDIIFTGWIGVPVHELGHAVFCILFRHKIIDVKLYQPNSVDGSLGYVNHSWDHNSTYQKIGNFFIGIGPIIFGAILIYATLYYLVPNMDEVYFNIEKQSQTFMKSVRGYQDGVFASIWGTTLTTLKSLFSASNFSKYKFWIFLYIAICVSSHMQLSPPDIKGAGSGLLTILLLLLVMNIIILGLEATGVSAHFGSWWNYVKIETYSTGINKWVGTLGALLAFSTIISAVNFMFWYIMLSMYSLAKGKGIINPLW